MEKCTDCGGTGFCEGVGDGHPSSKVRCITCDFWEDDPCTCEVSGYKTCPHHGIDAIFRQHYADGMYSDTGDES